MAGLLKWPFGFQYHVQFVRNAAKPSRPTLKSARRVGSVPQDNITVTGYGSGICTRHRTGARGRPPDIFLRSNYAEEQNPAAMCALQGGLEDHDLTRSSAREETPRANLSELLVLVLMAGSIRRARRRSVAAESFAIPGFSPATISNSAWHAARRGGCAAPRNFNPGGWPSACLRRAGEAWREPQRDAPPRAAAG